MRVRRSPEKTGKLWTIRHQGKTLGISSKLYFIFPCRIMQEQLAIIVGTLITIFNLQEVPHISAKLKLHKITVDQTSSVELSADRH